MIAPVFAQLAASTPESVFIKVDVDVNKAIAKRYSIAAMPTFFAFKNGQKIAETRGADPSGLQNLISSNK
jgi:thioredoxin 1